MKRMICFLMVLIILSTVFAALPISAAKFEEYVYEHDGTYWKTMNYVNSAAPFAYMDTSLFSGKRITEITMDVASVTAVDANQYLTVRVISNSVVKKGEKYTDAPYREYKVYIPQSELTSTSVNKKITVDVTDLMICVGDDETLAFADPADPVICKFYTDSSLPNNFYCKISTSAVESSGGGFLMALKARDLLDLEGKTFSVLGDSISTWSGISNDTSVNSTIGSNAVWYPTNGTLTASSETWWAQIAADTGMDLLVNNSWSGSKVLDGTGAAYQTRCIQLHNNNGVNPDLIAVFIGINDFNAGSAIGSFAKLSEVYAGGEYVTPSNVAQAYAIMVHKMKMAYPKSDIYLFTLPVNSKRNDITLLNAYNTQIKGIADYFDCEVVDLAEIEGYETIMFTSDGLHPNARGMDVMSARFLDVLEKTSIRTMMIGGAGGGSVKQKDSIGINQVFGLVGGFAVVAAIAVGVTWKKRK